MSRYFDPTFHYRCEKPIKRKGEYVKWIKVLVFLCIHGTCTKEEIVNGVWGGLHNNQVLNGWNSALFGSIRKFGYVEFYNNKWHLTDKGYEFVGKVYLQEMQRFLPKILEN